MPCHLDDVVPWGRSFDEYVAMFDLSPDDLRRRILGCGDGPASFNAALTGRGGHVRSVDPIYAFSADEIRQRIRAVTPEVMAQVRTHADAFVWRAIQSPEQLERVRLQAMEAFLDDFSSPGAAPRYVAGALARLPFADGEFELALCSHFLFLYAEQHSLQFHLEAIAELCRVAGEARIFPLVELSGERSRHRDAVIVALADRGYGLRIVPVAYEFQRGGREMLVVTAPRRRTP